VRTDSHFSADMHTESVGNERQDQGKGDTMSNITNNGRGSRASRRHEAETTKRLVEALGTSGAWGDQGATEVEYEDALLRAI